jgi:hypothetical protein
MIYWLLIIFGVIALSTSISNPLYKITIKKYIKLNMYFEILLRSLMFILSIIIIFVGLYFESVI